LPLVAFSQSAFPGTSPNQNQSVSGGGAHPFHGQGVMRVQQEQLDHTFTARDLIGKQVVNHEGDRLGTINDVGLGQEWSQSFGLQQDERALPPGQADLRVFVSTGGILGVGGRLGLGSDWVSVSAEQLLYDRQNDRFILNMSQEQFTAVSQGRDGSAVATTSGTVGTPGTTGTVGRTGTGGTVGVIGGDTGSPVPGGQGTQVGSTYPGGVGVVGATASAEIRGIEQALRNHRDLQGRAQIQVTEAGNVIQLSGVVDDASLIRRAGDIARQYTQMEVRNLLQVRRGGVAE
jgi:hypothetical protein